jgi:isocitrate lyase
MELNIEEETKKTEKWIKSDRFKGITRLYSARQVAEQKGTIRRGYAVAKNCAQEFFELLTHLHSQGRAITTFGPYSPGQAVMLKRQGIQGIYLGGWATSAKGDASEDPGSDLASYPLSRVPDEAAAIVRALLSADKNQFYARARMTKDERLKSPTYDYRPFIIADADTGHGGDAHVRNLIRRFVEVGVTGYHIEDQKPGTKKCGHQGGKVLVSIDEQIKRLNTARFQLDIMEVQGIIVARTDAEAATLLENATDERDHPFVLGATNTEIPPFKPCYLEILSTLHDQGFKSEIRGHLLFQIDEDLAKEARKFFGDCGFKKTLDEKITILKKDPSALETTLDEIFSEFFAIWEANAGIKTYGEAVFNKMQLAIDEGIKFEMSPDEWQEFSGKSSLAKAKSKALSLGLDVTWSAEDARTPDGYYQVRGSIEYAIAKSLAVAPFCDILWMETKTANLKDAQKFAEAIHRHFPKKMLAYNLSPSFNWDTTGMTNEEMTKFPVELGKLGFVFNFITYGGHQIDGLAAEEFSMALQQEGMLALAKLQRRLRLIDSPYKTPQTLVGGMRFDGALTACSGRTASTKAMGKGSTQHQHLAQTEVSIKALDHWLTLWAKKHAIKEGLTTKLRPLSALSDLLELSIEGDDQEKIANVIFTKIQDRQDRNILSIRNQGTNKLPYRQKRLMTLMQAFLVHRYKTHAIHYLAPTEDNHRAAKGMKDLGFFNDLKTEVGDIIVAIVNPDFVKNLLKGDEAIVAIIGKD